MNRNKHNTQAFRQAIKNTSDVCNSYCAGLGAFGKYAKKIKVPDISKINGSLDIDTSTHKIYPNDNRWDYAICYDGEVFYIEVHSAITSEVSKMINKLNWLKLWLSTNAPQINKLTTKTKQAYHWVQASDYNIPKHTSQFRALVQNKILPKPLWDYSQI